MSDNTTTDGASTVLTWGDQSVDFAALPVRSQLALAKRGLAHYLGNEQASKLTTWATAFAEENKREATDEEKSAQKSKLIVEAIDKLANGQIGLGGGGPRGTQLDTIVRQLAEGEVRTALKNAGLVMPTGDKTVKFPTGEEFTRAVLIARRIERHGERLRKDAERELARRARATKVAEGAENALADL